MKFALGLRRPRSSTRSGIQAHEHGTGFVVQGNFSSFAEILFQRRVRPGFGKLAFEPFRIGSDEVNALAFLGAEREGENNLANVLDAEVHPTGSRRSPNTTRQQNGPIAVFNFDQLYFVVGHGRGETLNPFPRRTAVPILRPSRRRNGAEPPRDQLPFFDKPRPGGRVPAPSCPRPVHPPRCCLRIHSMKL